MKRCPIEDCGQMNADWATTCGRCDYIFRQEETVNANATQVGGTHYRTEYQHWDLATDLNLGYFEGQITKYVTRWRSKNGHQDLDKAAHFCDKLIEGFVNKKLRPDVPIDVLGLSLTLYRFNRANRLWMREEDIIRLVCGWTSLNDLHLVRDSIRDLKTLTKDRRPDALAHERDPDSSAEAKWPINGSEETLRLADYSDEYAKAFPHTEKKIADWYLAQCKRFEFAPIGWLAMKPAYREAWRRSYAGRNVAGAVDPHGNPSADEQENRPNTDDGAPGKAYLNQ